MAIIIRGFCPEGYPNRLAWRESCLVMIFSTFSDFTVDYLARNQLNSTYLVVMMCLA